MIGKNMDKNVVLVALFAAVIAALGLIPKITLISGVPITAQSLGLMLCGTILGARAGAQVGLVVSWLNSAGLTSFGRWAWRFGRVCLAQRWVPNRISDRRLCHRMEHAALSAAFHWPSQRPGRPAWRYYCAVCPWRYWPIHNDR